MPKASNPKVTMIIDVMNNEERAAVIVSLEGSGQKVATILTADGADEMSVAFTEAAQVCREAQAMIDLGASPLADGEMNA